MSSPQGPSPLHFGEAIKFCRNKAALTQDVVGEKSGLGASYISNLERGVGNPTLTTLTRLATGLGVDCSKIMAVAEVCALKRSKVKG